MLARPNKKSCCRSVYDWFKQIYYFINIIVIIAYVSSNKESDEDKYHRNSSDYSWFYWLLILIISNILVGTMYLITLAHICLDGTFDLLREINKSEGIKDVMIPIFSAKPKINVSCSSCDPESFYNSYYDSN